MTHTFGLEGDDREYRHVLLDLRQKEAEEDPRAIGNPWLNTRRIYKSQAAAELRKKAKAEEAGEYNDSDDSY
jgi:hypothetical protein